MMLTLGCRGRNLCLIINIHDANNIPDEFQVNGDGKRCAAPMHERAESHSES